MDPRTFLRPSALPTADPPAVGAAGPALPGVPRVGESGRVVAFLRHVGCPFAEATLKAMDHQAGLHPATHFVAVSHGAPAATQRWWQQLGIGPRVSIVVDGERLLYAAWGLGLTDLGHFMGPRSLGAAVALGLRGVRNRHPSGSRWQSAGTFAVDAVGVVRWRHLPRHAGDLPKLEAALSALGDAARDA